jgi:hypothetical protein
MSLTSQQKIALFRAYAPILYFHPDERFVPVNPAVYIQSSSLWNGQPGDDDKNHWGQKDKDLQFPRLPLIPRGGISLNASEDTVNLLWLSLVSISGFWAITIKLEASIHTLVVIVRRALVVYGRMAGWRRCN